MHDSVINQTPLFSPHRLRDLFLCQVEVPFKLIRDPLVRNRGPNSAFRCLVIGRSRFQLRLVFGIEQDRSYRVYESFEETHCWAHSTSKTIRNGGQLWNWEIWESHWACMRDAEERQMKAWLNRRNGEKFNPQMSAIWKRNPVNRPSKVSILCKRDFRFWLCLTKIIEVGLSR